MATFSTVQNDIYDQLVALVAGHAAVLAWSKQISGLPDDAAPVSGYNATAISDTTAREILAAVAGKSYYISSLTFTQPTAAETPTVTIQDDTGTPIVHFVTVLQAAATVRFDFDPPIKIAAGKALNGKAGSADGDTIVVANGWLGTPA